MHLMQGYGLFYASFAARRMTAPMICRSGPQLAICSEISMSFHWQQIMHQQTFVSPSFASQSSSSSPQSKRHMYRP